MYKVAIVGIGVGDKQYLTPYGRQQIDKADYLIGATRLLESFEHVECEKKVSIVPQEIADYIKSKSQDKTFVILASGDVGFYSLSKKLTPYLEAFAEVEWVTGIGSMQYFCSKIHKSWEKVHLISAHGRKAALIPTIMFHEQTFLLTGGKQGPKQLCQLLVEKGLGHVEVSVGERLSYDDERIVKGTAEQLQEQTFDALAVMYVENSKALPMWIGTQCIADEAFLRGKVPMTKSDVRTLSTAKLKLRPDAIVYDVGAGSGSVAVDIALKLTEGTVYAIEQKEEAVELIRANRLQFKAYNIEIVEGRAPEALVDLPTPTHVFIGGSTGEMKLIIKTVLDKNPQTRFIINTITLQSLNEALRAIEKYKMEDVEITQVQISQSKRLKGYDMMLAQNPVYIISAQGRGVYA